MKEQLLMQNLENIKVLPFETQAEYFLNHRRRTQAQSLLLHPPQFRNNAQDLLDKKINDLLINLNY